MTRAARTELRSRAASVVYLAAFLDLLSFGIVIPQLPFVVRRSGGSPEMVGVVLAAYSFAQFFAAPVLGRWADRVGRRPVVVFSIAGNALTMGIFAVAAAVSSLPLLFVSRIAAGACAANLATLQLVIADITEPEERPGWLGRFGAALGVGMVVGPVLGGWLDRFGVFAPPLGAALVATLALALAAARLPETQPETRPETEAPAAGAHQATTKLERRALVVLALPFAAFFATSGVQTMLPLYGEATFGWGPSDVGTLFGGFGAVLLVVQGAILGPLSRRVGAPALAVAGPSLMACALVMVALAPSPVLFGGGLALFAVGVALTNPIATALATELAPRGARGRLVGLQQSAGSLARMLGPLVAGWLYGHVRHLNRGAGFLGASVLAFACAVLAALLVPRKRR